jgi:hypothetical protein
MSLATDHRFFKVSAYCNAVSAASKGSVVSGRMGVWGEAPERHCSVRSCAGRLPSLVPDIAERAEPSAPDVPSPSATPE